MKKAFEQAGVWALMRQRVSVAKYTHKGDPLTIDCSYQPNGEIKMFHAVSLETDVSVTKDLAFSYPRLVKGLADQQHVGAVLTAVVEDNLDRADEAISFGLAMLEESKILVQPTKDLPDIAKAVQYELKA